MEHWQGSSHNVEPMHGERLPYEVQSHIFFKRSMACAREGGRVSFKVEAALLVGFIDFSFGRELTLKDLIFILSSCLMIRSTRGCVTFMEAEY